MDGPVLSLWRAATDNDKGGAAAEPLFSAPGAGPGAAGGFSFEGHGAAPSYASRWEAAGLDRPNTRVLEASARQISEGAVELRAVSCAEGLGLIQSTRGLIEFTRGLQAG